MQAIPPQQEELAEKGRFYVVYAKHSYVVIGKTINLNTIILRIPNRFIRSNAIMLNIANN